MQARYVILRVLLEAGDDLVTISKVTNPEDKETDLIMSMDRSKIGTVGKKAIGDFLRKLQVMECVWNIKLILYFECLKIKRFQTCYKSWVILLRLSCFLLIPQNVYINHFIILPGLQSDGRLCSG